MGEEWLMRGPELEEVVAKRVDRRKGGFETAVVIPTFRNAAKLGTHLRTLENQTYKDFDVIIVYGEGDSAIENPALSILHVHEKGRNGCSGAYYIGEKTALSEGYSTIILADDDCIPESSDLLQKLVDGIKNGGQVVLPMLDAGHGPHWTRVQHYYGALRREVLEAAGLTYFPLFFGGDDVELMRRITGGGFAVAKADAIVRHPYAIPFFIDASPRRYYYTRGEFEALILGGGILRPGLFSFLHLMAAWSLIAVGRRDVGSQMLRGLVDGARMEFFSEKAPPRTAPEPDAPGVWDVVAQAPVAKGTQANMLLHLGRMDSAVLHSRLANILTTLGMVPGFFGKRIFVQGGYSQMNMILMLGAKSASVEYMGKTKRVFGERGALRIALGLLLVAVMAGPSLAASLMLTIAGQISRARKGADSRSYGIASAGPASGNPGINPGFKHNSTKRI